MNWIKSNIFLLILFSVINLVLTPISSHMIGVNGELMAGINFTLVAIVSLVSTPRPVLRIITIIAALVTLLSVWGEYVWTENYSIVAIRIHATLWLFTSLAYVLISKILKSTDINIKVIFGSMAGYIIIGLIGGGLFELLEYTNPGSVKFDGDAEGYDFYYYSFISLVTIGYGDIVPSSPQAKSLTIVMGIIGQFYMAVGVALFVGRHISRK